MSESSIRNIFVEAEVELALRGPILIPASELGPPGVDAVFLRDHDGRLTIPGSLLKGRLREAMDEVGSAIEFVVGADCVKAASREEDLATLSLADTEEFGENEDDQNPAPSRLRWFPLSCTDLVADSSWPAAGEQVTTVTAINDGTGTADAGALRTVDCPIPAGASATFRGTMLITAERPKDYQHPWIDIDAQPAWLLPLVNSLECAMQWIPAVGCHKSIGFGGVDADRTRIVSTRVVDLASAEHDQISRSVELGYRLRKSQLERDTHPVTFEVRWTLKDPFCLPPEAVNGNVFESETSVRGDVWKGALARCLLDAHGLPPGSNLKSVSSGPLKELCEHFHRLRLTTARPAAGGAGPAVPLPRSWIVDDCRVVDLARASDAEMWCEAQGVIPRFFHDWKPADWDVAERASHHVAVPQQLRVRTAIDSQTNTARAEQLFAQRVVIPHHHSWRGLVSFDRASGQAVDTSTARLVLKQLEQVLASGVLQIGKTKARATALLDRDWRAAEVVEAVKREVADGNPIVLLLMSDALLVDGWELVDENGHHREASRLDELYKTVFRDLTAEVFSLVRRFTGHRLIGGFRAWETRRKDDCLPRGDDGRTPYNPILLTEAGSVFVLQADQSQAELASRIAEQWLYRGLCCVDGQGHVTPPALPEWVCNAYGDDFSTNPFLPSNGYGEVAINHPCHVEYAPGSKVKQ